RQQLGWNDHLIVLSTRAWMPTYGIDILLNAFHQAYSVESRLRLILLGDGPLGSDIKQFIASHNLESVIYTPGLVSHEQLPDLFRAADIYMSCAYSDG